MNAREMFKELGYEYCKYYDRDKIIQYYNEKEDVQFLFWIAEQEFSVSEYGELKNITVDEFKAIQQQLKELGWLEEEKQEIKQETNFEHYKDRILDCCIDHLAVVKGIPKSCTKIDCNDCDFLTIQKECCEIAKDWLKKPYKKLPYKLSKFEFDLLNAYKNSRMRQCISNYGTLLEMYGKGHFKGIDTSTPIHEILDNCEVMD